MEMMHPLGMLCILVAIFVVAPLGSGLAGWFIDEVLKLKGTRKGIAIAIATGVLIAIVMGLSFIAFTLGYVQVQ